MRFAPKRLALTIACLALQACSTEMPPYVELHIDRAGEYTIADRHVAHADLARELHALHAARPDVMLAVVADRQTVYVNIATVLAAAKAEGFRTAFWTEDAEPGDAKSPPVGTQH